MCLFFQDVHIMEDYGDWNKRFVWLEMDMSFLFLGVEVYINIQNLDLFEVFYCCYGYPQYTLGLVWGLLARGFLSMSVPPTVLDFPLLHLRKRLSLQFSH